ncbi:hypothetical protein [Formosa haliotis]|uniref:hypothetical protein n=1 Tax=Formosa haliotis TaxID=1555194 RepID=UPI000825270A|nr:hypothetical protein [Formosa haliotis]
MKQEQLPESTNKETALQLQITIEALTQERDGIMHSIEAFEAILRQHLTEYIIETQELNILYKAQKRLKKTSV